ncbi:hypothetical protein F8M41_024191 [Gigaspora margarita]|uniref:Uncharacterized protein n=1 Tax=Gigaspora margarita TaxID=4874 RepID=A0A8H4AC48_GIGMA|nr:hypothetical protein F8M41_024191 [Gigaspora margarita]
MNALEKIVYLTSMINYDSNHEATDLSADFPKTSFKKNFNYSLNLSDTFQEQFDNSSFENSSNEYDPNNKETKESKEKVTLSEEEALYNEEFDQIQLLNYNQA